MYPYIDRHNNIPTYGVLMIFAIVLSFILLIFCDKNSRVKRQDKVYGASFALIGGMLGAKLFSILTSINIIIEYDLSFVDIIKNGFVFYGGLIGGVGGIVAYCAIYKINVLDFFDSAALVLPAGHAMGRIGCFCAGCCFGCPTDSFLGVTYHAPLDPNTPIGIPLVPTQLIESAYCLLIFAALMALSRKRIRRGVLTAAYMLSYSVCRFINEFFRFDAARGFLFGLSTSQIVSILLFLIGIALMFFIYKLPKDKAAIREKVSPL